MLRVKYCSNLLDSSGYSEAARNAAAALVTAGADVLTEPVRFETWDNDMRGTVFAPILFPQGGAAHVNATRLARRLGPGPAPGSRPNHLGGAGGRHSGPPCDVKITHLTPNWFPAGREA